MNWIRNCLKDRQQRAMLEGESLSCVNVRSRVSQGSVLGPILFSVSVNDEDYNIDNLIRVCR